jgi:hypothetical protein
MDNNTLIIIILVVAAVGVYFFWKKNCKVSCSKGEGFSGGLWADVDDILRDGPRGEAIPQRAMRYEVPAIMEEPHYYDILSPTLNTIRVAPSHAHKVLPSMAIINSRCSAGGRCPCPTKGGNFEVCADGSGRDMCMQNTYCAKNY